VHITVQLVHGPSDTHIWAESYDRDMNEAVSLPEELSRTIAKEIRTAVSPPIPGHFVRPEAHDAYLHGRYLWYAGDEKASQEYFEKAIQLQPDYAAAWSGLADSYIVQDRSPKEVMEKAEAAARKGVELDDSLAEAHTTMAAWYFFFGWNLNRAESEAARAVALNPHMADGIHMHCPRFGSAGPKRGSDRRTEAGE
jgi:tetratricopeptide (TPR) repeat protein